MTRLRPIPSPPVGSPTVHAVTVHHRGASLLDRCLRSLLAEKGVRLEVIVVANACDEPLPELAESHPRVHLVSSSRAIGFSAANNLGVRWAREHLPPPDVYFFVNNDTATEDGALRRLAERLKSLPECGVVGPRLMIWGAEDHLNSLGLNVTRVGEAWDEGIGMRLADYGELPGERSVLAVTGSALMIRASLLEEVGGWTELYEYYNEDIDLCLKARSRDWDVRLVPSAVIRHAISATSGQGSDFKTLLSWRNQLVLLSIHWPVSLLIRIAPRLVSSQLGVWLKRLRVKAYGDAGLQARAWWGAILLLPQTVAQRIRRGREVGWTAMLRPAGSVPAIRLPEVDPDTDLAGQPAAHGKGSAG